MIRKQSDFSPERRHEMRGGKGDTLFQHIWKPGEEMKSCTRLFSKIILEPGTSIGFHVHEGEEEIFFVLRGRAEVDDNGVRKILETGDSILTRGGEGHSIAASGNETLEVLAVIGTYPGKSS